MRITINDQDSDTFVVSKLDGKRYTRITHTHTKRYGYTIDSYCKQFNLTKQEIVCVELRKKLSWTKARAIEMYGVEDGTNRWNDYCQQQATTNTFEYKKQKHGFTETQFREYNNRRASTKQNFITRYGVDTGTKKWDTYCKKQAYAGCSVDYFIEKYGNDKGPVVYRDICNRKSNNLSAFINRYGKQEGTKRFNSYIENKHVFFSNKSQILFKAIDSGKSDVYYATNKKEYSVYDDINGKIYFYDYVDVDNKKCIEFNGDCFHANPKIYNELDAPNPFIPQLTAKEIWCIDKIKIDTIIKKRTFEVLVIWENDFNSNPDDVIKQCKEFLYER